MSLDIVYIACYKGDQRFARAAVASIRRWYPDVPISLIKDEYAGAFSTTEIEGAWNVGLFKSDRKIFGWGWSKLEPLFEPKGKRCLIMDADVVFIGPVLDRLNARSENFIVPMEKPQGPNVEHVRRLYYEYDRVKEIEPNFEWPGFVFNSGQFVGTSGILQRSDFERVVEWGRRPRARLPWIFKSADMGVLNFVLALKSQRNELSIHGEDFMVWPKAEEFRKINLERIIKGPGYPMVVHWAGLRNPRLSRMIGGEIVRFFEDCYYAGMSHSATKRRLRAVNANIIHYHLRSKQVLRNYLGPVAKRMLRRKRF